MRRRLLLFLGIVGLVLAFASPAYAQEGQMQEPFFELDSTWVTFLGGSLLPLLVGIVTKLSAPSWLKAILHLVLSFVMGALNVSITLDGVAVISRETLVTFFMTWITGMVTHSRFWQPIGVSQAINGATANVGIGSRVT